MTATTRTANIPVFKNIFAINVSNNNIGITLFNTIYVLYALLYIISFSAILSSYYFFSTHFARNIIPASSVLRLLCSYFVLQSIFVSHSFTAFRKCLLFKAGKCQGLHLSGATLSHNFSHYNYTLYSGALSSIIQYFVLFHPISPMLFYVLFLQLFLLFRNLEKFFCFFQTKYIF